MQRRESLQWVLGALVAAMALGSVACSDPEIPQAQALKAPVSMTAVDGEVCLPTVLRDDATMPVGPMPRCGDEGQGFALVANQRSSQVGVLALGQEPARFVNLDARRPGITQISVADRPVDIAATGDGTAALVASETHATITGIDLWTLRPLNTQQEVEGTPRAIESMQDDEGQWLSLTLTRSPNQIDVRAGLRCERPGDGIDRRDRRPDQSCEWADVEPQSIALPGNPVDMAVDHERHGVWVVYRDRNLLSWVVIDEAGLREDEQCLDEEATVPCEVDQVSWAPAVDEDDVDEVDDEPIRWGATKVDVDSLGLFTYVLDRPNNQLFIIDNQRRQLINASQAMEPPTPPSQDDPAISLVRSAMAMAAEVEREVIDDGDFAHVVYRAGVQVAANNGQLYRVGAVDMECRFEGGDVLSNDAFLNDAQRRADTEEARCLELPEFPLGGDPDIDSDEDLEALRFFERNESATLAVSPVFALRDSFEEQGRLAPSIDCEQPQPIMDEMNELADSNTVLGCESPLLPQPVGLSVEDDLDSYADEPRADLMEFARAGFDEDGVATIERSVNDVRLRNEEWTVSYEGALPAPGRSANGLVARQREGVFLSGGVDYCAAGVEVGDRITILSDPAEDSACDVFVDDDNEHYRSYEVVEVGPFELQLDLIDADDRVSELPTRSCFDRGLNYEIRPVEEWTVAGDQSGLLSPWEREGDACVMREDADMGWRQSRVETGEEFWGPYLRFRIREAEVAPVQGLEYRFAVERNFSLAAQGIVPNGGSSLPAQVRLTPDLGDGRYLVVVDAGGNRLFLRNLSQPLRNPIFLR